MTRPVFHDLGDSALSVQPQPSLDAQYCSTRKKGRRGTGLRVILPSHPQRRHGTQGWPAIPGARRYSHFYRDRQHITSRHPGTPASSYPIKGQARALQGETGKTQVRSRVQASKGTQLRDQYLKQSPMYSSSPFETHAQFPLSPLVTPTQAPRCKEIQNSPLPAGRRAFFYPNQDKSPCIPLASPSRLGTHSTHSSV
jgi:hypothetical protein